MKQNNEKSDAIKRKERRVERGLGIASLR